VSSAKSTADRFWSKVDKDGPVPDPAVYGDIGRCWSWTGSKRAGYGRCKVAGRSRQATHVALELSGVDVSGLSRIVVVAHRCDHPPCEPDAPLC
jgi:hypothetical protein